VIFEGSRPKNLNTIDANFGTQKMDASRSDGEITVYTLLGPRFENSWDADGQCVIVAENCMRWGKGTVRISTFIVLSTTLGHRP